MGEALRIWDVEWWDRITARDEEGRLQRKLFFNVHQDLQRLVQYSEPAAIALMNPPRDWINWVLTTQFDESEPLNSTACLACSNMFCCAWVALKCAGCGYTYWYDQALVWEIWCWRCRGQWARERCWIRALSEFTGLPGREGLNLYESAEQIITAFVRWRLNHELKALEIILTLWLPDVENKSH